MGKNWLQKKNIFFDDPVFFSSSITSVRIVGDCRPFQKHIGQAISTTFRFDKVNWGYVPISFRRLKTAKNGRKRLKTAENVTSWDDLRPILDINFDNTGDENRLKSPKIASFSFWILNFLVPVLSKLMSKMGRSVWPIQARKGMFRKWSKHALQCLIWHSVK